MGSMRRIIVFATALATIAACGGDSPYHTLTVSFTGPIGPGHLISVPAGIQCPGTCSAIFPGGIAVQVEFQPDVVGVLTCFAPQFQGCLDGGDCVVTMDQDRQVTWVFAQCPP
jgi:hypothetical protein